METLLNKIVEKKFLIDEDHLNTLHDLFKGNVDYYTETERDIPLEQAIEKCKTDLERIQLMTRYFVWTPVKNRYFERFSKNSEISTKLRKRGVDSFKSGKYNDAIREFSLAIAFGEPGNEDLGLAFLERGKFFLTIDDNKPFQALTDIIFARKSKCPEKLCIDVEQEATDRQKQCKHLNKNKQRISADQIYFKLSCPNAKLDCAEYFVDIDYKEDRGRRLVVTKHVYSGEKLLVQKPYAAVLKNLLNWDMEHCHFCYKPIFGGIPCKGCTFTIYCGEDCSVNDWNNGHQYEDKYLPYLHCIKSHLRDILSARIICKLGPNELYRLFKVQITDLSSKNQILGFNSDGIYESSSYLPIYHLVSHPNHLRSSEKGSNAFRALIMTHLLEDKSEIFSKFVETLKPKEMDEFRNFVASMILHHIENIPYNAISVSKLEVPKDHPSSRSGGCIGTQGGKMLNQLSTVPYAMALFSLLALCNHSCSPNAIPLRRPDSQTVSLIALKPIKPGEEIFISYAPHFTSMETVERIKFLYKRYNFTCACVACENQWNPAETTTPILGNSQHESIILADERSRVMSGKMKPQKMSEIQKIEQNLRKIEELIAEGNYLESVTALKPYLNILTQRFSPRFPLTLFAENLLKRAFVLLVNN